jgi:subtilisin family serine protease
MDANYPSNDRPQMRLRVKKSAPAYKIVLKSAAETGTVHFWNVTELTTDVGNWGMPFSSLGTGYTAGDNEYGIGAPACSNTAVTVAAYSPQTNTNGGSFIGGTLASFSSEGPLTNETLKPDISAPGVSIASSISSYTDGSFNQLTSVNFMGRDYPFARLSGTSMSSPVVAGVAALIWEANPFLSPWQIKQIIITTAREDIKTGDIPDNGSYEWGYGKIDAYNAIKLALNTVGTKDIKQTVDWLIYPNPTTEVINLKDLPKDVETLQIIDLNGKIILTTNSKTQVDVSNLPKGTYILRLVSDLRVQQQKFVHL